MRYVMKQKFFSLRDSFSIRNEDGDEVFSVHGQAFSLGDKLSVKDTSSNEVAHIAQKLMSVAKTYEITRAGRPIGVIKKQMFPLLRTRFTVERPGADDLVAEGDLLDHEYTFREGRAQVAAVSKRWFSWLDTYGIDISEGQDDVLILCSAAVIDLVCHQAQS